MKTVMFFALTAALGLSACGGGGGSSETPPVSVPVAAVSAPAVVTPPSPAVDPCTAPAVWTAGSNVCVAPLSTKVVGAHMLPAGCTDVTATCFKDNAKFISTGATFGSRRMMIAFFENAGPLWREALVYADDGTLVNISGNTVVGGYNAEIDWVIGTATGMMVHDKASGICYAGDVDSASQNIVITAVACPS